MEILQQSEVDMVSGGNLAYDAGHALGSGIRAVGTWLGGQAANLIAEGINARFNGTF